RNLIVNTTFYADGRSSIVPGKPLAWLVEPAVAIRGGEALLYDNYIDGFRFGLTVNASFPDDDPSSSYPIRYASGYLSGLALGPGHTGIDLPEGDGDLFYWNNSFTSYDTGGNSVEFHNYKPSALKLDRDLHPVAKPGYATFAYPHA